MIVDRKEYRDRLYAEFEDRLFLTAMELLEPHSASIPEKFAAAATLGTALITLGTNFLGNSCLMDWEESFAKAKEVLAFFKHKAAERLRAEG